LQVTGLDLEIKRYQEPTQVDNITKIQKDLDETREVMVQNIEKVIARGEKLDDLLDKTNDLSESSKVFVKRSKAMNSCCVIL
jgi:synaptobrevin homolog YKT6